MAWPRRSAWPPQRSSRLSSPPPVTNLSTANVLVVAGPDLAQAAPATATTVHTATTLHPATTTTAHATTTTTVHSATTTTVKT